VRAGGQVLICPDCQTGRDWTADLDACARCGSTALVRALGETTCRGCGANGVAAAPEVASFRGPGDVPPERAALAADVAAAIDRVLGRAPGRR
jgi:hypothetical protein